MAGKRNQKKGIPEPQVGEVAVLGAGMWGSVIAGVLHGKGLRVRVWDIEPGAVDQLRNHRHPRSMADWTLSPEVEVCNSLEQALSGSALAVVVVGSQDVRRAARAAAALDPSIYPTEGWVLCSKGLDVKSGKPLRETLLEEMASAGRPEVPIGVLSGPCIAAEVATGIPTSVAAAAPNPALADCIQSVFMTPRFRVYTQGDILGVELGGSLKNVIALAAGICDGLGFGANTKASLITRGLAEITRLGVRMGADARTFSGLAGMGDLVVTAFSPHSRNRRCGEALGRGKTLDQARDEIGMAIEGIPTCHAACHLGEQYKVDLPICGIVRAILEDGLAPVKAVDALMLRDPKPEWY